jgi:hypothetical protein
MSLDRFNPCLYWEQGLKMQAAWPRPAKALSANGNTQVHPQASTPIIHALVLLLYGVVLTLPVISRGGIFGGDVLSHLIMARHFVDQLWAGDLYPRWLSGMNAGLGSPVFQFYGPVPYYVTALFRPLLNHDPEGWLQLGLAASLAVIASGFTAYAWLNRLAGERAALVGAVLYMSAPYHLAVDLYQRFAFAELWGFVWMPLVMLFARASIRGGMVAMAGLSLSYALLIMTHLPTTLLFSWVPVAYALWMAEPGDRFGSFMRVAGGMLVGIGLSAIYLLPAMTTQEYVRFDTLKSGVLYFANNFLFDGLYAYAVSETAGPIMLTTAGLAVLAMLIDGLGQNRVHARERLFWGAAGIVVVFMMLPISEPVWRSIPVLHAVQFPLRFNAVLVAACAALVTLAMRTVLHRERKFQATLLLCAALGLVIPSIVALGNNLVYARVMGPPSLNRLTEKLGAANATTKVLLDAAIISRYNSFLPRWSTADLFADTPEAVQAMKNLTAQPDKATLVEGKGSVLVKDWRPPHIELAVNAETALQVGLLQLYYPGWVARLDGVSTRLDVRPSSQDGLLEVKVPPGKHRVLIEREPLPAERAGQMVSGASLALLGALALWWRRQGA